MQGIHKQEMMETVQRYLPELREKKVIIFGHCHAAEELLSHLEELGVAVHGFLDNNPAKQGKYQGEIPIYAPDYLNHFSGEDSIVLIITRYFHAMANQLRGQGYEGTVVEVVEFQSFQAFSTHDAVFAQKVARVKEGFHTLEKMKGQGKFLVLCPYRALGDVYWGMSYLPAFLQEKKISSCTIAVVGNPCGQVAEMFGHTDIFVLQQKDMDAVLQAVICTEEGQAVIAHHGPFYPDGSLSILEERFIPFPDYYKTVVYGLSPSTPMTFPTCLSPLSPQVKDLIKPEKTVILAPYAHSVVGVPWSFWEDLALTYEKKGFLVMTNLAPGETPISGTLGLTVALCEMQSAVERAGYFVGLRSGLCDLLQGAKCEKTLVFAQSYFGSTPHTLADFFALEGFASLVVSS